MQRYDDLMFTPAIKALQDKEGVADTFAKHYARKERDGVIRRNPDGTGATATTAAEPTVAHYDGTPYFEQQGADTNIVQLAYQPDFTDFGMVFEGLQSDALPSVDYSLGGCFFPSQAIVFGGGVGLCNALDVLIGL